MSTTIDVARRPLQIAAGVSVPRLLSRAQLVPILSKFIPTWESFKLSKAIHALRLWGADATFGDPKISSPYHTKIFTGRELLSLFIDHRHYLRLVHASSPILESTDEGVLVRYRSSDKGFEGDIAHVDKLLRVCGELGIPSDTWIRTPDGEATLHEVVRGAVSNFDREQELEWTVEAFARYFEDSTSWTNRFGETFGFDGAVDALVAKGVGKSPCFGTHLPYVFAILYQLNEARPFLGQASKGKLRDQLVHISGELERSQQDDGSWPLAWSERVTISQEVKLTDNPAIELTLRLTVLGHHLEWIGFSPPELRPGEAALRRAVDFAIGALPRIPPAIIEDQYHALTHLAKALCAFTGVRHAESYKLLGGSSR